MRWSPRPISELLFCSYGWLVNHLHRPLIGAFLGLLWFILIATALLTFLQNRRRWSNSGIAPDLPVSLALLALFVAGGGHTLWVLYWPAGAVAYLPTLAATMLLFFQVAHGRLSTMQGRFLCSCCLIVASFTSEMGATFGVCYGGLQAAKYFAFRKQQTCPRRYGAWWMVPTILSTIPLLLVSVNRFSVAELPAVTFGPTKGHPVSSLIAGAQELAMEILGRSVHHLGAHGLGSRLLSEILLIVGVGLCWSVFGSVCRQTTGQVLAVIAALLLAALLTLAAANLHFGVVCCDQHETLRRCWILLCFAGAGILLSNSLPRTRWAQVADPYSLGCVLLCAAVLVAWHIRPLIQSYQMYAAVRKATAHNFDMGFQENESHMTYWLLPQTLIAQPQIPPGPHGPSASERIDVRAILQFFKKENLVAVPPADWLSREH